MDGYTLNTNLIGSATDKLKNIQNILTTKLKSNPTALQRLRELNANPDLLNQFDYQDVQDFYLIKRLAPNLFEEPKQPEQTLTPSQKLQNTTLEKSQKANLAGLVNEKYEELVKAGYAPDIKNKSFGSALWETAKFPLKTLLNTINTIPRAEAATTEQIYKRQLELGNIPKISEFNLQQYTQNLPEQAKKNLNPLNPLNAIKLYTSLTPQDYKEISQKTFEPIIKPTKSKYAGYGWADALKNIYAGTKFTQPFTEYTKDWSNSQNKALQVLSKITPNEQGNWWQRLTSGFAGSPADITGLAMDIILDPLTYIGGGAAKGSVKTGAIASDDIIKGTNKVLPKGAEIVFTKEGTQAFADFAKRYPNLIKIVKEGKVLKGFTTPEAAKSFINQRLVNKFIEQLPDIYTANKYIDYGGLKIAGETVIPGYKLAQTAKNLEKTSTGGLLSKLFNENAKIPKELIPYRNYILSQTEAEQVKFIDDFKNIIKNANKEDLDKVQKYLWTKSYLERQANKLDNIKQQVEQLGEDIPEKTIKSLKAKKTRAVHAINKLEKNIEDLNLTQKQLDIGQSLADFWKKVAEQYTQTTGRTINTYDFYTPIRYVKEGEDFTKTSMVGAFDQPFVKARKITQKQAAKLGLQPKSLIENTFQRLWEQSKSTYRTRLFDQMKQFASRTEKEGFVKVKNIPELEGWYIPKDYEQVIKNVENVFFGDKAVSNLAKGYDRLQTIWKRWALATPGYHFRNFFTDNVSGLFEYGLNYLNPKHWDDAVNILFGTEKKINLGGVIKTGKEWKEAFTKSGEIATQIATEADLYRKSLGKLGKLEDIISKVSIPEYSLKAGNIRESLGRVVAGVIERKKGLSDIMASANVKKVFFDYPHLLTPFEKNIVTRAIPFYRWLKGNLRRQIELIFTRMGQYATIPKAINFIEDISQKPELYQEYMPEYAKDLSMFITPLRQPGLPDWLADLLGKPKTAQAGMPLMFNPNYGFQDISRLNLKDLFISLSPMIKTPIELATNKDIFFGTDLDTGKLIKAPDFINAIFKNAPEDILNKFALRKDPEGNILMTQKSAYLLKQNPFYALSYRMFPAEETENTPYQRLSALLGIKFTPYNEEKFKEAYFKKYNEELDKALNQFEQTKYTSEQIEKGQGLPSTSQITSAYKDVYKQYLNEKYADVLQLKDILEITGANKELNILLKEMLKPYYEDLDRLKGKSNIELEKMLKDVGITLTLDDIWQITQLRKKQKAGD